MRRGAVFSLAGLLGLLLVSCMVKVTHKWGGLTNNMYMGLPGQMTSFVEALYSTVLLLSGTILMIAAYHLFLFITGVKTPSSLYFSLFCFSIFIWYLFSGDFLFFKLFPVFPLSLGIRLEYLSLAAATPLLIMFVDATYPDLMRRSIVRWLSYAGFVFMLVPAVSLV